MDVENQAGRVVPREGEPNWGTVERRIERVNEAQKAAGKLRDALSAAQSSIQSLLDAQEQREQLERQLRSLETASGR